MCWKSEQSSTTKHWERIGRGNKCLNYVQRKNILRGLKDHIDVKRSPEVSVKEFLRQERPHLFPAEVFLYLKKKKKKFQGHVGKIENDFMKSSSQNGPWLNVWMHHYATAVKRSCITPVVGVQSPGTCCMCNHQSDFSICCSTQQSTLLNRCYYY